jgi:hypothetical protein
MITLAIDGFGVQTCQPFDSEVECPKDYLPVVILMPISCTHSGSTNDMIAWQESQLLS